MNLLQKSEPESEVEMTNGTVLQHGGGNNAGNASGNAGNASGAGGFNCHRCGKAEYRNGEFATIKLGDIFTHIDNFPSATSSETLCASCNRSNDAAATTGRYSTAATTGRHGNLISTVSLNNNDAAASTRQHFGASYNNNQNYANGVINLNSNNNDIIKVLPPLTNGTSTIVSHNSMSSSINYQLNSIRGSPEENASENAGSVSSLYRSPQDNNINTNSNSNSSYIFTPEPVIIHTSQNQLKTPFKILVPVTPDPLGMTLTPTTKGQEEEEMKVVVTKTEGPRVPCTLCKKTFKNQTMANIHLKRVHEKVNRFVCEICGVGFSYRGSLDSHLVSHNPPEVTHDCPTCGQKFKEKSNLNKHIRYHTENPKKFLCEHCPSGFSKRVNLRYHIKRKHPEVAMNNNNSPIQPIQGYFTPPLGGDKSDPGNMTTLTTLTPLVPLSHNGGGASAAASLSALSNPPGVKSSSPPTAANTNGKEKAAQGNFKCESCGRGFLFKNNLKAHLRTHTRDKKYTCDLCQKSFIYKESLKNHMLLHSNELPYLCDICGKKFRDRSNRRKHVKNVHKYMFVNGDINNPIPTGGTIPITPAVGTEAKKKKGGGSKKSEISTEGLSPKGRNIIKSPRGKKSKSSAPAAASGDSSSSINPQDVNVINTNAKSVIVSTNISLESSASDRKIIMSPSPKNGGQRSPGGSRPEFIGHSLAPQFSHGNRNIIVKAAAAGSATSMSSSPPTEIYLPALEQHLPIQQNVIVYNKGVKGHTEHFHEYPSSAGSGVIQQQQQQYYSSRDDPGGHFYHHPHDPPQEQQQQHYNRFEYILSASPPAVNSPTNSSTNIRHSIDNSSTSTSTNLSNSADIKMEIGEIPVYASSNFYPEHQPYHPNHHQQHQQIYWRNSVPPGPGSGDPPGSSSSSLHPPAYGQPHATEPGNLNIDPTGHVSNFLYKDLSQFDFSYL